MWFPAGLLRAPHQESEWGPAPGTRRDMSTNGRRAVRMGLSSWTAVW
ncbi:unnamed protein product [Gulo gulo]|uniref:Uncharacterized protein n=1 Tax=Gulo gulo TaxID=48420 RepID=A0A9X9Q652_GULGU|nr:unnamed protein product [Gulo gulo]